MNILANPILGEGQREGVHVCFGVYLGGVFT